MTDIERLAIAQAVYKAVGAIVSTNDPASLRAECDDALRKMYADAGVDRIQLRVRGQKVGTLSLVFTKPIHTTKMVVADRAAFEAWALANGYAHEETQVAVDDEAEVLAGMMADGVLPDGCEVEMVDEPAGIKGTTIRGCTPESIAEALGDGLADAVAGLLTAPDDMPGFDGTRAGLDALTIR